MVTGDLAAGAMLESRAGEARGSRRERGARYVRTWKREIGGELRDSVLIQRYLFHSAPRMDVVVRGAQTRAPSSRGCSSTTRSGRLSYRAARRRMLWHFPRLLPRLTWVALRSRSRYRSSVQPVTDSSMQHG